MKNLVIVESPSKAKTIQKYLGDDFVVTSCMGHIRDLPENDTAIDIEHNFEPVYEVSEDKKKLVADLKKLATTAETVWLASDEDREGEAIAWHLSEALHLDERKTKRIVFHEITKPAILKAISNPRTINKNLVDAQQARRVLDRLVGYGLSPVLWRKVQRNLSAGRVQSVAVRLVVEREREVSTFVSTSQFKVSAEFDVEGKQLFAELPKRFDAETEAQNFLERCVGATYTIADLETKPGKRSPSAPFTTSTLQQEASRKLGFSLSRTMKIAQDLYEAGFITYMRTDSVNLSELAIDAARMEISSLYGATYSAPRAYTTKVASAQEAHEAIRPTEFSRRTAGESEAHKRLYDLIWKRTVASQMADARLERTTATVAVSTVTEVLQATGEVLLFDGFLKVYMESSDDETNDDDTKKMLPPLSIGQSLSFLQMTAEQRFARPPARYTEASLVKKLEELGIGRPSTYAPTISTIQNRKYVIKEDRDGVPRSVVSLLLKGASVQRMVKTEITGAERSKLFPTDIGMVVTDFLTKHFDDILDYQFTANVEKQFDEIAEGDVAWSAMIRDFYVPFRQEIDKVAETAERQSGERELGVDPVSGKRVSVRLGRYGPLAQIGDADDPDKRQKGLPGTLSINSITLDQALELFKFPKAIGTFEGFTMEVKVGRFGPYIEHNGDFYSIPKSDDPHTIQGDRGVEIILAKRQSIQERTIKTFEDDPTVKILKGRWGPFIAVGKQNVRIPKGTEAADLTLDECLLLAAQQAPPAATKGRKKAAETSDAPASNKPAKKAAKKTARKAATKKAAPKK
ncbi:MAG: type I DNA topoisomerase [Candidatus Kapabacteria bacterium]|jgi:DNA topoisomerase-1|nr:type I DNA topoisomerase [Candidatus Kapabacteria bacterium]